MIADWLLNHQTAKKGGFMDRKLFTRSLNDNKTSWL